jgi:hypothetical protein
MDDADVVIEVDGKNIPMNDFVRKFLSGMISGSIGALHNVSEDWKTINIRIKR